MLDLAKAEAVALALGTQGPEELPRSDVRAVSGR
jgi:hypothetical protein